MLPVALIVVALAAWGNAQPPCAGVVGTNYAYCQYSNSLAMTLEELTLYDTFTCIGGMDPTLNSKGNPQGSVSFTAVPCDIIASSGGRATTDFIAFEFPSNYISNAEGAFDSFTNLVRIDLSYNFLTSITKGYFSSLTNLQTLQLNDNFITFVEYHSFANNQLTELRFENNNIAAITPGMFNIWSNSLYLTVYGNPITSVDGNNIHLAGWSNFICANNPVPANPEPGITYGDITCTNNNQCFDNCGQGATCTVNTGYLTDSTVFTCPLTTPAPPFACVGNDCGLNSTCIPHENGYRCQCNQGYLSVNLPRNGKNCQVINLCKREHTTCGENSQCTFTGPRQVSCACNAGFVSLTNDGKNCVEVVSCASPDNGGCGEHSTCTDVTLNQVSCRCNEGYHSSWNDLDGSFHRNGKNCQQMNPCKFLHTGCGFNSVCHPEPDGQYSCTCWEGFASKTPDNKNCRPLYDFSILEVGSP